MKRVEAGFTLVEVLVVLVAGSLLLMSLSWVLQGSARQFREVVSSDAAGSATEGLETLSPLIESALPANPADPASAAAGQPGYTVPAPAALGALGPIHLQLLIRADGPGQSLIARFSPTRETSVAFAPIEAVVLRGVSKLTLQIDSPREPNLPAPIRLQFERDGHQQSFVARPRVTTDGTCRFDPISLACRP